MFTGQVIVISSVLFFAIATYATLLSPFLPLTGFLVCLLVQNCLFLTFFKKILDVLAKDTFYKYFLVLLIPTTSYFVIANWVGWQYYRNS